MGYRFDETEISEERVIEWIASALVDYEDLETKLRIYADADENSAAELKRFIEYGVIPGDKRLNAVFENEREFYSCFIRLQVIAGEVDRIIGIYRELFPESPVLDDPVLRGKISYIERRASQGLDILLGRLGYRKKIMEEIKSRAKKT
jgi:hypothetical protein